MIMSNQEFLSVGQAAARIPGATPQAITNAFYGGLLRADLCPLIAGRRAIPVSYVEIIEMVLRRAGKLRERQVHQ
jgi:hypothetical protein